VNTAPDEEPPDVADIRPGGSADLARDEALPTVSIPIGVRSVALTVLTVIAVTWALWVAQTLFVPLLVGIVISLVLSPLVEGLRRAHLPRPLGATIVLGILVASITGVGYQLSAPAADLAEELPKVARRVRLALVRSTVARESPVANLQEAAE
jgi:predicted PurR-regulated permease PerM